jgi:hypothetical protein
LTPRFKPIDKAHWSPGANSLVRNSLLGGAPPSLISFATAMMAGGSFVKCADPDCNRSIGLIAIGTSGEANSGTAQETAAMRRD